MKIKTILILSLLVGVVLQPLTYAQETVSQSFDSAKYVRLFLHNGEVYEGEVIEISEADFLIETPLLGKMRISKLDISNLIYIDSSKVGEITDNQNIRAADINPQATRYFFSPSGYQLEKGEGYYSNTMIMVSQMSYGITDYLTVGTTMTPIGLGGTLKLGGAISDNLHVSVGGIFVQPATIDGLDLGFSGIAFANLTLGDERKNLTLSYGLGFYKIKSMYSHKDAYFDSITEEYHPSYEYYDEDTENWHIDEDGSVHNMFTKIPDEQRTAHIINLSAMFEISNHAWIMLESYLIFDNNVESDYTSAIIMGVRKASRRRGSLWDIGLVSIPSEEQYGIPWCSLTLPF